MQYIYFLIYLVFSFIHAEMLGADYVHKEVPNQVFANSGAMAYAQSSKSDTCREEALDLFELAQEILDEVLQFDLKTANSAASNCEHNNLFVLMREKSPVYTFYDEFGCSYYFLDEIFNRAKKSIEYGVANCVEYAQIVTIFFLEKMCLHPNKLSFKYVQGQNFDHEYFAIGRQNEDPSQWVVIDAWLRKKFPWNETPAHLKQAGVNPTSGAMYEYKTVGIFDRQGNYHPEKYNLRTLKKLVEDNPCSVKLELSGMYNVPYESRQKYYDPETRVMTIGSKIRVRVRKKI